MDKSLVSVPTLCDAGCKVIFGEHSVQVTKNNKVMIEGDRDVVKNLWLIPLKNDNNDKPDAQSQPQSAYIQIQLTANSACIQIEIDRTPTDLPP